MSLDIKQLLPSDGSYWVIEKRSSSYDLSSRELPPARYKVVAWAVVGNAVLPMILGTTGLVFMPEHSDYKVEHI